VKPACIELPSWVIACMVIIAASPVPAADGFRQLAPGVLTVIPPYQAAAETAMRADLLDITVGHRNLAWQPREAAAGTTFVARGVDIEFPRDIWSLEFAFKPPRTIEVDVPVEGLKMRRKRIWYLVYRVRNVGGRRTVTAPDEPAEREVRPFEKAVRFLPQFVLESRQPLGRQEGSIAYRAYLDRVLPTALSAIRQREDPRQEFLDSAAMAARDLEPGETRWGVATWEDVDPRITFFSIYVRGLTNALVWRPRPGVTAGPDSAPGSHLEQALQSLRLDFWRPGDDRNESDDRLHIGYDGMFERMALGGRLIENASRTALHRSRPGAGLDRLGLAWKDLLEPVVDDDPAAPDWIRLRPLVIVLQKLAAREDPETRLDPAEDIFGDLGAGYLQEVIEAVGAAAVSATPQSVALLEQVGLPADALTGEPIAAVSALVEAIDPLTPADRQRLLDALIGPAGRRLDWLAREATAARMVATLESLEVPLRKVLDGDARAALEGVRPAIESQADPGARRDILRGLFGPRGPQLYAAAVAVNEGIDHTWVFRFED